ncbi:MAG: sugar phosphate nucleotidyltransferase [Bdellovibrionales bacterium]
MSNIIEEVPVVILAGGKGLYLDASGERVAKGNVLIKNEPLVSLVLKCYVRSGFRKFFISGSYQLNSTIECFQKALGFKRHDENVFKGPIAGELVNITFIDSGLTALTADRLRSVAPYIRRAKHFAVTYSDTIAKIDLAASFKFHLENNKVATLTAAHLPTRFRVLGLRPGESIVRGFGKAFLHGHYVNGGFYFFNENIWSSDLLGDSSKQTLETDILDLLAARENLAAVMHEGPWQHLDSERDIPRLQEIAELL